jgi:hypothetical protein
MAAAPPTPQDKLTVRHEYMDVENLLGMWRRGQLLINEEYQRSEVWKEPKQRLLIDSLIKGYSISSFILRDRNDGKSEVLDGQQRLKSLDHFTTDSFSLASEDKDLAHLDGLIFSSLPDKIKYSKILARHVHLVRITSDDEGVVTEIFLRLQEGMPLNYAEKLHAMRGKMRDAVLELAQEAFLKKTGVSQYRFNHRYVMAQALAAEMRGVQSLNFTQLGARLLKALYLQHQLADVPAADIARVRAALRFLDRSLKRSAQLVETNPDLLTLTNVASYLLEHYAIRERESRFDDFVLAFLASLGHQFQEPYSSYAFARSTATVSKDSLQRRFEAMLSACLEFIPDMPGLDPQRQFDRGMKLALYHRAQGKCESCGKEIRFIEAEADHAFAWSRGGTTTLDNAQLLCISCNRSKGAN